MRQLVGAFAATVIMLISASHAFATEYSMTVYFADRNNVMDAIGSKNPALEQAMLGDKAYVEDVALEARFSDKDMWKRAVADLVAGNPRQNSDINGYALALLFRQVASSGDNETIGLPFADLHELSNYLAHAGQPVLAEFFSNFDYWKEPSDAALMPIWKQLGHTEYHSQVSVIKHEDAAKILNALNNFDSHLKGAGDYQVGNDTPEAQMFEKSAKAASTAQWTEYAETNDLDGETPEELVGRMVRSTMEDPYHYYQNIEAVSYELDRIKNWLRRADNRKQDIFAIYYSY